MEHPDDERHAWVMIGELLPLVAFVHSIGILHLDLRLPNFFADGDEAQLTRLRPVNSHPRIVLGDFGDAVMMNDAGITAWHWSVEFRKLKDVM
jgi:serine/threonine protein kinase